MNWQQFLIDIWKVINIYAFIYLATYLARKGWNDAENRTKKVCDVCFRDLKKWNEVAKKNGLVK